MTNDARPARNRWTSVAVFAFVILLKAVIPMSDRRSAGSGLLGPDKPLHFLTHVGFAASLATALEERPWSDGTITLLATGLSIGYGIGIEYLQEVVPGRAFEFADIVADVIGSLVGVAIWRYVRGGD